VLKILKKTKILVDVNDYLSILQQGIKTQRILNYFLVFSVVLVGFFSIQNVQLIQFAEAQESFDLPRIYEIRITLVDIGEIDLATGSYDLTFWILMENEDIDFTEIPPPELDYVNGLIDIISHESIEEHYYSAKVHGTFSSNFAFHDYPLAKINLTIIVEPAAGDVNEVLFKFHEYASAPVFDLTAPGWVIIDSAYQIIDYHYPEEEVFSRYTANFVLSTPFLSAFMVGIFPIFIMGAIVLLSFLINPTLEIRPEIITATLIAAVFFHVLDVGQSLPPLEYLTLEDKMMTVLYSMMVFGMIELAVQRKFNPEEEMDEAVYINKRFRQTLPIVIIGTGIAVWFL